MKKRLKVAVLAFLLTAALSASAAGAEPQEIITVLDDAPRSYLDETPYLTQCELGCAAADAVRDATGAQIALVNVGDLQNDLNQGEVAWEDVLHVFGENRPLAVAQVTGEALYRLLEHAVSQIRVDPATEQIEEGSEVFDGFCQVSGFTFRYDASAPVGERIVKVVLVDGTEVLPTTDTTFSLTATEQMLSGGCGFPAVAYESAGIGLADALAGYLEGRSALPEGETARITVIGARNNTIVGLFPKGVLTAGILLLVVFLAFTGLRFKRREET